MNFINPFILLGLAASSIPIIIHLLNLRKKKKIDFSTLKFLNELKDNKIRKLKIKQWLLLIIRTLIIISLVFAFSRPVVDYSIPFLSKLGNLNGIFILDNSFSMDVSDEKGNKFRRAKTVLSKVVEKLDKNDKIDIINLTQSQKININSQKNPLYDKINKMEIDANQYNLESSLKKSIEKINQNNNSNSKIYVISDFQNNFIKINDSSIFNNFIGTINFVPMINKSSEINLSIDSIILTNSIIQYGRNLEFNVFIRNHSPKNIDEAILNIINNDQNISQKTFNIKSNENLVLPVSIVLNNRGANKLQFSLENDANNVDNNNYYSFHIPEYISVCLIAEKENKFLNKVLELSNERISIYNDNELSKNNLSDFDIVYLAPGDYSKNNYDRIVEYVKKGGKLVVYSNPLDSNDFDSFKNNLGLISDGSISSEKAFEFTKIEYEHPIFDGVFKDKSSQKILESVKINFLEPIRNGNVIISTEKGQFLNNFDFGEGKILYFSVTPDLYSSDFPLNNLFPSIVVRSIYYLTSSNRKEIIRDNKVVLKLPNKFSSNKYKIIDPKGNEFFIQSANLATGEFLILDNLDKQGFYDIYDEKNKIIDVISINHNPDESNILQKSKNELLEYFENINENISVNILEEDELSDFNNLRTTQKSELWKLFVLFAIILAFLELIVQKTYKNEISA